MNSWLRRILFVGLVLFTINTQAVTQWVSLAKGLEYTKLYPNPDDHNERIHAFRIDLNHFRFRLAMASDDNERTAYVSEFAQMSKAVVAINGGFF